MIIDRNKSLTNVIIILNFKNYDRNKSLTNVIIILNFKNYDRNKSLRLHSFIAVFIIMRSSKLVT